MRKLTGIAVVTILTILLSLGLAFAQDPRQNEPGKFDFYLLALSWSPSYCEASRERAPDRAPDAQCGPRPFSFVVHGLWPHMRRAFRNTARYPHRASIAAPCRPCSI
jgi:ribonuclease T2